MCNENLKEALEYAVDLRVGQEVIYYEDGVTYYDRSKASLEKLNAIKYAEPLIVNSLSGFIGFLKANSINHQKMLKKTSC